MHTDKFLDRECMKVVGRHLSTFYREEISNLDNIEEKIIPSTWKHGVSQPQRLKWYVQ